MHVAEFNKLYELAKKALTRSEDYKEIKKLIYEGYTCTQLLLYLDKQIESLKSNEGEAEMIEEKNLNEYRTRNKLP